MLCIIPARGGSKRIPLKNIRNFHDKPMISWAIQACKSSEEVTEIVVSSDSDDVGQIAQSHGAKHLLRSKELSDDKTGLDEVVADVLKKHFSHKQANEPVMCLLATAAFVKDSDISKAFSIWSKNIDYTIISVGTYSSSLDRALEVNANGLLKMKNEDNYMLNSQDCKDYYFDAGMLYVQSNQKWLDALPLFENAMPLVIPKWRVHDIDNTDDWIKAELVHKALFKN
tara:strand:+ start:141 stop:821 length:681 start_codon:yes stop_codon:yes gene_type:complete